MLIHDYCAAIRAMGIYSPAEWHEFVSFFPAMERQAEALSPAARALTGRLLGAPQEAAEPHGALDIDADWAHLRTVGIVSGCFDVLHLGHLRMIAAARDALEARAPGALLAALVLGDAAIAVKKGPGRPVLALPERLALLAECRLLDRVLPIRGSDCRELIRILRPRYFLKSRSDTSQTIVNAEAAEVEAAGGAVILIDRPPAEFSTTRIIERCRAEHARRIEEIRQ